VGKTPVHDYESPALTAELWDQPIGNEAFAAGNPFRLEIFITHILNSGTDQPTGRINVAENGD
jgi:hypothetical protein